MSPSLLGAEEEAQSNVSLAASSSSMDCFSHNGISLKERNYMGLSDCSSVGSSNVSSLLEDKKNNLNLKATELRLGLPGSQSPERDLEFNSMSSGKLDERTFFPLLHTIDRVCPSQKNVVIGNKRGFSEVKSPVYTEGNWMFHGSGSESESSQSIRQGKFAGNSGGNVLVSARPSGNQIMKELPSKVLLQQAAASDNHGSPASKAQVVGWPPIRSFRKNSMATTTKNNDEVDGEPGSGVLFVKVSMDGAPFLRKVDLSTYSTYHELSAALEKMFSCFTIGPCGSDGGPMREKLSESKLKDLLHGTEYVLTFEDKDGDWMLVGDVPWQMFIGSCRKLKIVKGSDAIGLAPRAMEKSRIRVS